MAINQDKLKALLSLKAKLEKQITEMENELLEQKN